MFAEAREFWQGLPGIIHFIWYIVFTVILLKGVVTKDITNWLEDRGFIKTRENGLVYKVLDFIFYRVVVVCRIIKKVIKYTLFGNDRKMAIWSHFKEAHPPKSVLECTDGKCAVIA
jgi:hypothetical protein